MSYSQALELLDSIELKHNPGAATIKQLANGEYVVIVQKSQFYCWNMQDWLTYVENEKKKATSGKKRSRNAPDYREMLAF